MQDSCCHQEEREELSNTKDQLPGHISKRNVVILAVLKTTEGIKVKGRLFRWERNRRELPDFLYPVWPLILSCPASLSGRKSQPASLGKERLRTCASWFRWTQKPHQSENLVSPGICLCIYVFLAPHFVSLLQEAAYCTKIKRHLLFSWWVLYSRN